MSGQPLPIVCMAFGEPHPMTDIYIDRLHGMLKRHCRRPFELHCFTDVPRPLPAGVIRHDCSGWTELDRPGMRRTTRKLGLFNPDYVPFDEFLYLDLSLVIRRDMEELLMFAFGHPADLVIVPNWHYDGFNSSVMRIRRGGLRQVYDSFIAGETYKQKVLGDQDFTHGAITAHGLRDRVALFPAHIIVSFKKTVRLGRHNADEGRKRIANATIVKFHGEPKMHEAFGFWYRLTRVRLKELVRGHWAPVIPIDELRRQWTGESAH
jgi:hypothetical protein